VGMKMVPVIIVAGNPSKAEVRTLRLSINRAAEFSDWDPEALIHEFEELNTIITDTTKLADLTGFDPKEVIAFLSDENEIDGAPVDDSTPQELDVLEPSEEPLEDQSPIVSYRDDVVFDQNGAEGLPSIRPDMLLDTREVPVAWAGPEYTVPANRYLYTY